jgi:MFS family permease
VSASSSSTASSAAARGRAAVAVLSVATGISIAGSALNTIGLLSYVYDRTHAATPIGIAVIANFLPVACILPFFGGQLARRSLHRSAVALAWGQAAVGIGMAVAAATTAPLALLYAGNASLGLLAMAQRIAVLSMLPRLVERSELTRANLLLQMLSQAGAVIGAVGLVAGGGAPAWVLLTVDAATFVLQGFVFLALRTGSAADAPSPEEAQGRPGAGGRLPRRLVLLVWLMPSAFVAMNVLNVAIPLVVLDRIGSGQRGYAAAEAVYPALAIAAGLVLRRFGRLEAQWTLAAVCLGFALLAFASSLAAALAAVAVLGAGVVSTNAATQVVAQAVFSPRQLPVLQVRAASLGAAISAGAVVAVTWAFARGHDTAALTIVAIYFALLVPLAVAFRPAGVAAPAPRGS